MSKLYDQYGNHIGNIDFKSGRISDQYGNHTGNIDLSSGRLSDQYGNHTGNVDLSSGRISDQYGNHIGNIDLPSGRVTDQYGNHTGKVKSSARRGKTHSSSPTSTTNNTGFFSWIIEKLVFICVILLLAWGVTNCDGTPSGEIKKPNNQTVDVSEGVATINKPTGNNGSSSAYSSVLNKLVSSYGFGIGDDLSSVGLVYASVEDFDSDGIDELICIYDNKVALYTYTDGKAKQLLLTERGYNFGATDISATVYFSKADGRQWVGVNNPGDNWDEESKSVYSVQNGKLLQQDFHAWRKPSDDFPSRDEFTEFRIDGKSVTKAEYFKSCDRHFYASNVDIFDVELWFYDDDLSDSLQNLMQQLEG